MPVQACVVHLASNHKWQQHGVQNYDFEIAYVLPYHSLAVEILLKQADESTISLLWVDIIIIFHRTSIFFHEMI